MIIALSIFNKAFWLHIPSKNKKGWPKQEDYNCPKCDFNLIFLLMDQSKKPITEGKELNMANQYNKTHQFLKNNKR
jgi:hypothetical protein